METNSNTNPSPPNKTNYAIIGILIVAFVIGLLTLLNKEDNRNETNLQNQTQPTQKKISESPIPSEVKQLLNINKAAKISFPTASATVPIERKQLPAAINRLIPKDAAFLALDKITYTDNSSGYYARFTTNVWFEAGYKDFLEKLKADNWKIINNTKDVLAGILEAESTEYKLRISIIGKSTDKVEASIQSINNTK